MLSAIQKCPKCGYPHKEYSKNADGGVLICLRCNYRWKSTQAQNSNLLGNYKYTKKFDTQALFNVKKGAANKVPSNMLIARLKEKKFDNTERIISLPKDNLKSSETIKQQTKNVVGNKDKPKFKNIFFANSKNKSEAQLSTSKIEKTEINKKNSDLQFNQEKDEYLKNRQTNNEAIQTNNSTKAINELKEIISKPLQELSEKTNIKDPPPYDRAYVPNKNNTLNKVDLDSQNINRNYNVKKDTDIKRSQESISIKKATISDNDNNKSIKDHSIENDNFTDYKNKTASIARSSVLDNKSNSLTQNQDNIPHTSYENKSSDISTKIDLSKGYDRSQFENKQNLLNEQKSKAVDYKELLSNSNKAKATLNLKSDIDKLSNINKINSQKSPTNQITKNISNIKNEIKVSSSNQTVDSDKYVKAKYPNITQQNYSELINSVKNNSEKKVFSKEELEIKKKNLKPFELTTASKIDDLKNKFLNAVSEQEKIISASQNFEKNKSNINKNTDKITNLPLENKNKNNSEPIFKDNKTYNVNQNIDKLSYKLQQFDAKNNNVNINKIQNSSRHYDQNIGKLKSHTFINEAHETNLTRDTKKSKKSVYTQLFLNTKQIKSDQNLKKRNMFDYFNITKQNSPYVTSKKSISRNVSLFFSNIWQNILYQVKTYFNKSKLEPSLEKQNNSSLFLGVIQFPKGFFTYLLKDKKQIKRLSFYTALFILVILGFAFEAKRTNIQSKEKIEQIVLDNPSNTSFSKEQLKNGKYITPNSIDGNLPLLLDDKRNAEHEANQKADIKITDEKEAFALSRDKVLTPEVLKEELSTVAKLDKYKANQKANIDDTKGGLSTILTTYKLNWKHFKNNIFNNIKLSDTYNSWDTKSGTSILQTQVMISNSSSKVSYLIRSLNITFLDIKGLVIGSRIIMINKLISPQEQTNLLLKIPDSPSGTLTSRVFINEQIEH